MLKEILRLIEEMGYISKSLLASKLNINEDLVTRAIEDLIRMGYILEEEETKTCSSQCGSCPYASSCNKTLVKSFQLSERGLAFLEV